MYTRNKVNLTITLSLIHILDHSMIPSAPGKELFYVWFEQYTRKTDPTQFIEPTEEELNDY